MMSRERSVGWAAVLILASGALAISAEALRGPNNAGDYDWDYFFFQSNYVHRSLFEFRELPLWNPWYMGGVPGVGNLQVQFPSPWVLVDLVAGPIAAIKLKIVAHYLIGVAGMYWMGRQIGLSRLASVYASGTFIFSSWLALRVHSGHLTYLSTTYMPLVVGLLARSVSGRGRAGPCVLGAGAVVAIMVLQGGIYDVIFTGFILGPLALAWSLKGRSVRPLAAAALIGLWGLGLSAVKLVPVLTYMQENPRESVPGGRSWGKYLQAISVARPEPRPADAATSGADPEDRPVLLNERAPSKWDLPAMAFKSFLGREQRSNQRYFPIQGYGWHEYGVYVGPLALILAALAAFLAPRAAWPWLGIAALCFFTATGNFAAFAPWTLLHKLPVLKSMHCPSRLLTPCIFAATIAAGYAVDAIRGRDWGSKTRWVHLALTLLLAASLLDSVAVARNAIRDVFPFPPAPTEPRQPAPVTIGGRVDMMNRPMLANYSTAYGYEPIKPKIRVTPREAPGYRGEAYFVPEPAGAADGRVELVAWSHNSVTVRASSPSGGRVVLNRNWNHSWRADPPYVAEPYKDLISAPVGPGEHQIRFAYWPRELLAGAGLSLVSLGLAISFLVVTSRREVRRPEPSPGSPGPSTDPASSAA